MNLSRHLEVFNPTDCVSSIHIIGLGATGANIGVQLVKLGIEELHVYDFDDVEEHNIANQVYNRYHVGTYKTVSFIDIVGRINPNCKIKSFNERVTKKIIREKILSGIIFLCVDSMGTRKELMEEFCMGLSIPSLIIDTRMGKDKGSIFSISQSDYQFWKENSQYGDADSEVSACGTSISVYPTANTIASIAVWQFIKKVNGKTPEKKVLFAFQDNVDIITTK